MAEEVIRLRFDTAKARADLGDLEGAAEKGGRRAGERFTGGAAAAGGAAAGGGLIRGAATVAGGVLAAQATAAAMVAIKDLLSELVRTIAPNVLAALNRIEPVRAAEQQVAGIVGQAAALGISVPEDLIEQLLAPRVAAERARAGAAGLVRARANLLFAGGLADLPAELGAAAELDLQRFWRAMSGGRAR